MSLFGTKAYVMGGLVGVPGLAMFIGPTFLYAILGLIIAFVVATIVTYLIGFTDERTKKHHKQQQTPLETSLLMK